MNNYIINESSKNIRMLARQNLKGIWKPAILAMLIFGLCSTVPTIIFELLFGDYSADVIMNSDSVITASTGVSALYGLLIDGAFSLGIAIVFLGILRERRCDAGQIFSGFGYYFKALGLYIVMMFFIVLWACLLIVPGIIAAIRYSQAFYILADDPDKDIMQCIRESKEMMKGNKAKYFCLQLSFIGWYLLAFLALEGVMTVGVVLFIIFPDLATTMSVVFTILISAIGTLLIIMFLMPYVQTAATVFYEMANGNLRPQSEELPPLSQDEPANIVYDNYNSVNNDKIEF